MSKHFFDSWDTDLRLEQAQNITLTSCVFFTNDKSLRTAFANFMPKTLNNKKSVNEIFGKVLGVNKNFQMLWNVLIHSSNVELAEICDRAEILLYIYVKIDDLVL